MTEIPSPSAMAWLKLRRAFIGRTGRLLADRVPHGFELQEARDLPWALDVGAAANDPLDVVGRELLELGRRAVGAAEIDRIHVHMRGERRCDVGTTARKNVDHT